MKERACPNSISKPSIFPPHDRGRCRWAQAYEMLLIIYLTSLSTSQDYTYRKGAIDVPWSTAGTSAIIKGLDAPLHRPQPATGSDLSFGKVGVTITEETCWELKEYQCQRCHRMVLYVLCRACHEPRSKLQVEVARDGLRQLPVWSAVVSEIWKI